MKLEIDGWKELKKYNEGIVYEYLGQMGIYCFRGALFCIETNWRTIDNLFREQYESKGRIFSSLLGAIEYNARLIDEDLD